MTREQALEASVIELGKLLSMITSRGMGNPAIRIALDKARNALKMGRGDES
tara:strand:+ start:1551 stop:1703 length:153 start_codon:yes stop_codon:yes gene_type:complete